MSLPMSGERLPSERCARYNKREFEAFAARKLAEFREQAAAGGFADFLRGEHAPSR